MAFFALSVSVFIMFFQPTYVFPQLEAYQPLRNSAVFALLAFILSGRKSSASFLGGTTNRYFLLFAGMQILSASGIWITGGIESFNLWLRMGIVYYLIVKSGISIERIRSLSFAVIAGICYLSYYSVSHFALQYSPGMRAGGFGWYENANDLAIILVSCVPLCLLLANTTKSFLIKCLFVGIAALFSFNILFSASRNGLLGLLTVGALGIFASQRIAGFIRVLLLGGLVVGIITVGLVTVMNRSDLAGLTGDDSSENRIEQWKAGLRMVSDHPLLGVGPDEFGSRAQEYGGIRGLAPHNTFVQVFSETGIPGGIFFLLFSLYPFIDYRKMRKLRANLRVQAEALTVYRLLLISLAGFWVCAFFSNRYQFYILYVLVALLVAVRENILKNPVEVVRGRAVAAFKGRSVTV